MKTILTAYTENPLLAEVFAPKMAKSAMPSFYKTLQTKFKKREQNDRVPNSLEYQNTIRTCFGIGEFNKQGFVLPLWCDYSLIVDRAGDTVGYAGAGSNAASLHDARQSQGVLDSFYSIKLHSPWVFRCNKDIKFIAVQNTYAVNSEFYSVPPAVVDFYHQGATNIFVLINRNQESKELILNAGLPLVRYIPLTEEPVELRVEVVPDVNKMGVFHNDVFLGGNSLAKLIRIKKEIT